MLMKQDRLIAAMAANTGGTVAGVLPDSEQGDDKQMEIKLLDMAYDRYSAALRSSLLVSALLVIALWTLVAHQILLAWLVTMWGVMLLRNVFVRRYLRISGKADINYSMWRTGLMIGAAVAGMCWGVTVFLFSSVLFDLPFMMSFIIIAGVCAFASVEMAAVPRAPTAFMSAALLPVTIWMMVSGELAHFVMGMISLAYLGFSLSLLRQMNRTMLTSLSASRKNVKLSASAQESDQRMSRFFESAPGFFYTATLHPDGTTSMPFTSIGVSELLGIGGEELAGSIKPLMDITHEEDFGRFIAARHESLHSFSPLRIEFRINHARKGERWIELRSLPQSEPDGCTSWHGFMHDITERKLMEEKLVAREYESRTLIENSPDNISRYSRGGQRIYVNPAFGAMVEGGMEEIGRAHV
jgi:PAS domain S-box-containing protein